MSTLVHLTHDHLPEILHLVQEKLQEIVNQHPSMTYFQLESEFLMTELATTIENYPGYGIVDQGKLLAYLFGFAPFKALKGRETGAHIPFWGHAIPSSSMSLFFQLYRQQASDWVAKRVFSHIITYFPQETALQEFLYAQGFGMLVIDAIRDMDPILTNALPPKFTLRPLTISDYPKIVSLEQKLELSLQNSPIFLYSPPSPPSSGSPPFEEYCNDSRCTFVIETQGHIVAAIRGILGHCNVALLSSPSTLAINFAYTDPQYRGLGLGTHLINAILDYGRRSHMARCTVDFESANMVASRFWLRYFEPLCFSAIRKIDNRIV